jgi:hypothetical protein
MTHPNDLPIIDAGGEPKPRRGHGFLLVLLALLALSAAVAIGVRPPAPGSDEYPKPSRPLTEGEKEALLEALASQSAAASEEERLSALVNLAAEEPLTLEEMQDAISQL